MRRSVRFAFRDVAQVAHDIFGEITLWQLEELQETLRGVLHRACHCETPSGVVAICPSLSWYLYRILKDLSVLSLPDLFGQSVPGKSCICIVL